MHTRERRVSTRLHNKRQSIGNKYGDYRKAMGLSSRQLQELEDNWDPLADQATLMAEINIKGLKNEGKDPNAGLKKI